MLPFVLLSMWLAAPAADTRTVRIDHRVFPGLHEMDGNWAALSAAGAASHIESRTKGSMELTN